MKRLCLICALVSLAGSFAGARAHATFMTIKETPVDFSMWSFFYGPPVNDPANPATPVGIVNYEAPISIQNQLGLTAYLTENFSITPTFDFEYLMTDPFQNGTGQRMALSYDSFVKLRQANLISTYLDGNPFTIDGEIRLFLPTSEFSRDNGSLGSIRAGFVPSLALNNSNFSFSFVTFVRYWLQTEDYMFDSPRRALLQTTFYAGPQVNYALNDSVSLWALLEAALTVDRAGELNTSDPDKSVFDLEPGIDIRVTDNVYVSPYLNWFTNQPLSTASFNLTASLRI